MAVTANEPNYSRPAIFSPQAVWGFATVFTPVVGGLLARNALREAGEPAAARKLLWQGIGLLAGYFVLRYALHRLFSLTYQQTGFDWLSSVASWLLGLPFWLFFGVAGYYLKREMEHALPDVDGYPPQSVRQPLVICLVVFGIPFLLFVGFVWLIGHMGP